MTLATEQVTRCDVGGKCDGPVSLLTVVFEQGRTRPWEVDLCSKHYRELFGDLVKRGRKATMTGIAPRHRVAKTEIGPENL